MCTEQCGSTVQTEVEIVATILGLAVLVFFLIAYSRIIAKTGNPWWWIFLGIVPIFNLAMILFLAFRRWPVQKELELTRQALEAATGSPFPPGSQLPRYGKYQIGSGLGYGAYPHAGQGYAPGQDYSASSYGAAPTEPFYGAPPEQANPYSGFTPSEDGSGNPYAPKP